MSAPSRPNPDALLAEIQREEKAARRGRLNVFFGMSPGVGKTFAMLEAARARQAEGIDIVVGIVETHGRIETEALLAGLPVIPRQRIEYRGVTLQEMNIDAILARRPALVLVDELAHTNAPGSRHPKRYQDVIELLDAGIDVYATLNVQHLESRVDVVQQITGITIRETVPDSVLDHADAIELVDLTPDQLRKRLAEGKVYLGERAATAAENFFREENLTALREMALRTTAQRVDQELRDVMRTKRMGVPWKSGQRLAVGVGPSPWSGVLIRWTRRIAAAMGAPWLAIYVETSVPLDEGEKTRLTKNLSLAQQLGAEVIMTTGDDIANALLLVAREQGVTEIVVGKPLGNPLIDFVKGGSLANRLIRRGGDIDVHVVSGEEPGTHRTGRSVTAWLGSNLLRDCGWGSVAVGVITVISWVVGDVTGYWAVGLLYLLGVVLLAMVLNHWAVLWVAALSAMLWNFLFIPPRFTFRIESIHDIMMFGMYFVVALVIGHFTNQLRTREAAERRRQRRVTALNRLLQAVTVSLSLDDGLARAIHEVDAAFTAQTAVLLAKDNRALESNPAPASTYAPSEKECAVAAWAFDRGQSAGRFTDTLPDAEALYVPLQTAALRVGVLGLKCQAERQLTLDERTLLETFAAQIAGMIERYALVETAQQARIAEESERLHRTLLDSVSHELKTPLAVINAATDGLDTQLTGTDVPLGKTFLDEIKAANRRLNRIVTNLLDMTRIETGRLQLHCEWGEVRDLVDSAVEQLANEISPERIHVDLPDDLPLVQLDFGLMEQALCNLLLNATQHAPGGSTLDVRAVLDGADLCLSVSDRGPGLEPGDEQKVFAKFYRGRGARVGGTGLGLSIVDGIVRAHHGTVSAANQAAGGVTVMINVPVATSKLPV